MRLRRTDFRGDLVTEAVTDLVRQRLTEDTTSSTTPEVDSINNLIRSYSILVDLLANKELLDADDILELANVSDYGDKLKLL